jgi:glutaredoxin
MDPITVYTKPACVQCNATFRALDRVICVSDTSLGTLV